MPKMKSNRGASKRLRSTASGKLKRNRANARHILTKKSSKRKRRLGTATTIAKCDMKRMRVLVPYK